MDHLLSQGELSFQPREQKAARLKPIGIYKTQLNNENKENSPNHSL